MAEIRGDRSLLQSITAGLGSRREELLIGYMEFSREPTWLGLVADNRLATDSEVTRDEKGLHWTGELTSSLYQHAQETNRGVLFLHAHAGQGHQPGLSRTDRDTLHEILPHLSMLLPDLPHAYVVVNQTHVRGFMQLGDRRQPINMITAATCPRRLWIAAGGAAQVLPRDDRQAAALGAEGQRRLRGASIGVIGLGGAGSQVVEMLAHAGVGELRLVDGDVVKDVNLSRTHGTTPEDLGRNKVDVAADMIGRISPETKTWVECADFPTGRALTALRDVAVIVSCVDRAHARDQINQFSLRFGLPLVDVGITITSQPIAVDGHLTVCLPGSHCLRCAGHVSDPLLEAEQQAARRGDYGLGEGRPQVVSFNGLLASAAVTEVLRIITGFGSSEAAREFHYDPMAGVLREIRLAEGRCRDCGWYSFRGDKS